MQATFGFVDLAGFTALTEAHGAHRAAELVERFTILVKEALGDSGRLIDKVGDAVFVMTPEPGHAVRFIAGLFGAAAREVDFLALRAGLHHGEALERQGSFFGMAVNVAARVTAEARGGQVVATTRVAEAARDEGVDVLSLGTFALRNVREPLELFALNVAPTSGVSALDPVCRMRVQPERAAGHLRVDGTDYWFCSLRCAALFAGDPKPYTRG
jgi:adenylate cyclase